MRMLRFEGATMRDAIAKVKAELGDQAVIISTRQIRRGLLGSGVEISAAVDDDREAADPDAPGIGPTTGGPMARQARDDEPGAWSAGPRGAPAPAPAAAAGAPAADLQKAIDPIKSELRTLRAIVRASNAEHRATGDLRSELASLRKLVEELRAAPRGTGSEAMIAEAAGDDAAAGAGPLTAPSRGRVVMLVGPTGAGKTTTVAKLAANAALVERRRVRVITLDTYRVGGIEQMRTFTDLIGVPLDVAESPAHLASLLLRAGADLTLIDTAGRSPRDTSSIVELAAELPRLPPIEVHVVAPAAASAAAIDELVNRYRPLQPARLLFTKLDEVDRSAELSQAPLRTGLPITWITTGQAVPEDIEEPSAARVRAIAVSGLSNAGPRSTRAA